MRPRSLRKPSLRYSRDCQNPMKGAAVTARISVACLDMAGTTVADEGSVMAAFRAAMNELHILPVNPVAA